MANPWHGVDFDGTLVEYEHGNFRHDVIGTPVPRMVDRVKKWLEAGEEVRIVTARVYAPPDNPIQQYQARNAGIKIQDWTFQVFGVMLAVTNEKDYDMIDLWDDRARQVIPNTGLPIDENYVRIGQIPS